MLPGRKENPNDPKPNRAEVDEARERAFAAVTEWLHLATRAGQSLPQIMRELGGMMTKKGG